MAQVSPLNSDDQPHLEPVVYHAKARDRFLFAWYIIAELAPIIIQYIVIFGGMIWMVSATVLTKYLTTVPGMVFIEVAALNLPSPIVIALPMAMLLGSILAFQKLSNDSESVAMLSSGISFYQMLKPTVAIGVIVTIIGLCINNSLVPYATYKLNDMKAHVLNDPSASTAAARPFNLPDLRDHNQHLLATVHIEGGYDTRARAMRNITIVEFDPKSGRVTAVVNADKARWKGNQTWEMYDVNTMTATGLNFSAPELATRDINAAPNTVAFLDQTPDSLTFEQLARQILILRRAGAGKLDVVRLAEVDLWNKISLPCASLVFALIGAPLGFRPQRGGTKGTAVALGLTIVFAYYFLYKMMEILGQGGHCDPFTAAFLPDFLAAFAAAGLIATVTT